MRLSVLVDNNTLIDRYFIGEPAVCYFIETDQTKVLFDVGYSDAFLRNARRLGIDVSAANYVVLSHGHIDHTGGLDVLLKECLEERLERQRMPAPTLVAHPDVFIPKYLGGASIGMSVSEEVVRTSFDVQPSTEPVWLDDRLVFLGQIARENSFETTVPMGHRIPRHGTTPVADPLTDDSALVYVGKAGLHVITGCSHAGICNIIAQSQRVTGVERVVDVIGGLHLLDPPQERLEATVSYFDQLALQKLHACHCTDLRSRIALARCAPLQEVGSGLVLECE